MRFTSLINLMVFVSALGCGLMAWVFFAFPVFVMKAPGAIQPVQGISAIQSINVALINPWFMIPFLGVAVVWVLLVVAAVMRGNEPGAWCVIAGARLC